MSTRSATVIREERTRWKLNDEGMYEADGTEIAEVARFYRHCDGYPDGHGLQMATSFVNSGNWSGRDWFQRCFGPFMTGEGTVGTDFESWGAPTLEFEPQTEKHGDLEYLYAVTKMLGGELLLTVWDIGWDEGYETAMASEPLFEGSPTDYAKWAGR